MLFCLFPWGKIVISFLFQLKLLLKYNFCGSHHTPLLPPLSLSLSPGSKSHPNHNRTSSSCRNKHLIGCKIPPTIDIRNISTNKTPCSSQKSSPTNHHHRFTFFNYSIPSSLPRLRISNSAPVTPPIPSPTSKTHQNNNLIWESLNSQTLSSLNIIPNLMISCSAPTSPTRYQRFKPMSIPECDESGCSTNEWKRFQDHGPMATSPTFHLVKPGDAVFFFNKGKGV
ncbi:putative BZR family protein [Helianthus anomalus]